MNADALDVERIEARAYLHMEILELQRQSRALWRRLARGEDNSVIRSRIERLETLLAALGGAPELMATRGTCGACGSVPEAVPPR
ncbi:hypothetical protein [Streptomyces sp. AA1529]|uniref:hypothetical protein n=1 Tax=Streptomyces sp. AA1529 TaxID=1203257 RepID=UPI00031DEB89|nr:hypothetical protein [Streptomyces sp. AA1529]